MNYRKILLAVDGSEQAMRAAKDAVDLVAGKEASILLLNCYNVSVVEDEQPFLDKEYFSSLEAQAKKVLEPYEEMLRSRGVDFASVVESGIPEHLIVEMANQEKCDLIVMGSRGLGKVMGLVLGSVTKSVVQTAPCSVLVVR